jgi:hypothetical protein
MKNLSQSLTNLQSVCYGLFYNTYTKSYECIISETEHTFTTIVVGTLLGFSTDIRCHSDENDSLIVRFQNQKSLLDMLDDPIEFNEWYKLNCKK